MINTTIGAFPKVEIYIGNWLWTPQWL